MADRLAVDRRNPGLMSYKAVRLELLDQDGDNIRSAESNGNVMASGFLVREAESIYLYTCWHVLTGVEDFDNPKIPGTSQRRAKVRVHLQASRSSPPGIETVGGASECTIDICDMATDPPTPLWDQDEQSSNFDTLDAMRVRHPFWHDVARVRMPNTFQPSDIQLISFEDLWLTGENAGDPVLVVGYPYGYSAMKDSPLPFVLRRSIAAVPLVGSPRRVYLDGPGAPGMSGGPVFRERDGQIFLLGVYTGSIFPERAAGNADHKRNGRPDTALGTICPLLLLPDTKLVPAAALLPR